MIRLLTLFCFTVVASAAPLVLLDGFHNNETRAPDHYRWEGTKPGGFSELGKLLHSAGYELETVHERVTAQTLAGAQAFIIVDPDTPAESDSPQYLMDSEIQAIDEWVQSGGKLVLLGNDKGNAEFEHFNRLAARFGIEFLETTYPHTTGKAILIAQGHGSIFEGGLTAYLVEVAPLKLKKNADVLLSDRGTPIMALARRGQGQVFAVGDPWLYNEYIDRYDNRRLGLNLFQLLLGKP